MLILIWIVAILLSTVLLFKSEAVPFKYGNETLYNCQELWNDEEGKYFTIAVFVVTFGFPILALMFVYTSIGLHIIRRTAPGNPDITRDMGQWVLKVKVFENKINFKVITRLCCLIFPFTDH